MTPHVVAIRDMNNGRSSLAAPYERQSRDGPFPTDATDTADDEFAIAALVRRVLRLQQEISMLAGAVAGIETQIGLAYRRLTQHDHARSADYLLAADEADRYAAHKREEQCRWRLT